MKKITKFGTLHQQIFEKWIPKYGFLSLIAGFLVNSLIYSGTQQLMKNATHYDFTTTWDRKVPFVKEWVIIYLVCYIFWVINYILISREGKEKWYRFATADMISRLICGIFFILLPTTNVRPQIQGNDFISMLMRMVYNNDLPTNLFPSIHCLVSWYCFVGIRKSTKIPKWYKVFSCIFAILVCISTQFTKQHYLIDIAGGILLAEFCFYIVNHTNFYLGVERVFDSIGRKMFGDLYYDE